MTGKLKLFVMLVTLLCYASLYILYVGGADSRVLIVVGVAVLFNWILVSHMENDII